MGIESGMLKIYDASAYLTSYTDAMQYSKERQKEGPVYKVIHQYGLLIWANKKFIYVKHYTRTMNTAIIQIERPDINPVIPNHFYGNINSMPFFEIKKPTNK